MGAGDHNYARMMPPNVVALAAFVGIALIPGLPLSLLLLRRTRAGAAVVVVVGVGVGLATWLLIGLPAVHHRAFDRTTLAVAGSVVALAAWVPARHHLGRLRPGPPGWLSAWLAVLAVPAVWLRSDPIYFAYQVADFGEYVNRGNVVADGGPFGGWFVNGFPLMMAESHLLLGQSATTDIMPFLGLTAAVSLLAALHLAGAGRAVVAVAAIPLTFHVHSVWFSMFPASETLYGTLLVLAVLLAVAALRAQDRSTAVAAGAIGFLLVITRGNGLVFLPVVAAGLALVPVLTGPDHHGVLRAHLGTLGGALWLGTVYDARYNPRYFLEAQAAPRLPGPFADWFTRLDEPWIAVGFTVFVAIGLAAAAAVGLLAGRVARHRRLMGALRRATVGLLVLAVVAVHLVAVLPEAYLPRYEGLGVFIWVAVPLAVVVWLWRGADSLDGVQPFAIGWPLLTGLTMATFQATRMRKSVTVDAPWFLYWDRYFFSEAFPMLLLAGAVAAGVVVAAARRSDHRWTTPTVAVVAAVVIVAGLVDMAAPTRLATQQPMFDDAYDELAALDSLMSEDLPVVYHGLDDRPEGWFWNNSSRVIADPLTQTFERRVLNPAGAAGPDPRPEDDEIGSLLRDADLSDGYVLQVSASPSWREVGGSGLEAEVVGERTIRFERLDGRSRVRPEHQQWVLSDLHVRVVRVSTADVSV